MTNSEKNQALPIPIIAGTLLLIVYSRLLMEYGGNARFGGTPALGPIMEHIGTNELRFWASHFLLAIPAFVMISYGLSPILGQRLESFFLRLDNLSRKQWRYLGCIYFILLVVIYRIGNWYFLMGYPIADDQNAVLFGGRMLANGDLRVPAIEPADTFTMLFILSKDGMVSSMDWIGVLAFSALSELLHMPILLYVIASALTGLIVAATAGRLFGDRAKVITALFWLTSPMVFTLSLTTHAHVSSRFLIALSLFLLTALISRKNKGAHIGSGRLLVHGLLLGIATGLAVITRPFESTAILGACYLYFIWHILCKDRSLLLPLIGTIVCFSLFMVVIGWYNYAMIGDAFTSPRAYYVASLRAVQDLPPFSSFIPEAIIKRIGNHTGFNIFMLSVWFLGPVGLPLICFAFRWHSKITVVLTASVVGALALSLAHNNIGIHTVGPIHYSETAIPLLLLATAGILRLADGMALYKLPIQAPLVIFVGYLVLGMGSFLGVYGQSLRGQAELLDIPYAYVRENEIENAIIVSPNPHEIARFTKNRYGTWQLQHPHPDPYLRDSVIFTYNQKSINDLVRLYPDRNIIVTNFHDYTKVISKK